MIEKQFAMFLMLIVVVLVRGIWNLITYYKINGHVSRGHAILAPIIFWWFNEPNDSKTVSFYKKVGNLLSIIGLTVFVGTMIIIY